MFTSISPSYLAPLVGYAMYHLSHGKSQGDVDDMLAGHKIYGSIRSAYRRRALDRAILNLLATSRIDLSQRGQKWSDLWHEKP